jgi:hypothetical protein
MSNSEQSFPYIGISFRQVRPLPLIALLWSKNNTRNWSMGSVYPTLNPNLHPGKFPRVGEIQDYLTSFEDIILLSYDTHRPPYYSNSAPSRIY